MSKQTEPPAKLIDLVETFLEKTGMGPSYFGRKACNNSELVARLRDGGDVHSKTDERVRDFIAKNMPAKA